jgi:GntR family transcriptional regulator
MSSHAATLVHPSHHKIYVEIAHILRGRARTGQYLAGQQLPSINALAEEFGVAVTTVRQALSVLENEGLLFRRHGVGTFIREDALTPSKLSLPLDFDWNGVERLWESSSTKILAVRDHSECVCCTGDPGVAGTDYFYMQRVHSSDSTPYSIADIYIEHAVFSRAPERFKKEIALHVLGELMKGKHLDARETITIDTADVQAARHLQIPLGAPVVTMKRIVRDADGRVVYAGVPIYRGDIVRLDRTFKI